MSIEKYLKEIDNEDIIVMESSSVKEVIMNIVQKIKNFILKIFNWVKEKVYKFLKIAQPVNVNKDLYNDCKVVLSKLDSSNTEDKLETVKSSQQYKNVENKKYNIKEYATIKPSEIKNEISNLNQNLNKLKSDAEELSNMKEMNEETKKAIDENKFQMDLIQAKTFILNKIINESKFDSEAEENEDALIKLQDEIRRARSDAADIHSDDDKTREMRKRIKELERKNNKAASELKVSSKEADASIDHMRKMVKENEIMLNKILKMAERPKDE